MKPAFHSSIEGAQHGAKTLAEFLAFAKASGAFGAQPSNFHFNSGEVLCPADHIKAQFASTGLLLDGVSAHCPFWVHTTAWTGSPTIRPFIPENVAKLGVAEIEQWAENYILRFLDLCAELGVKIVPMFWGQAFGLEVSSGYPWGFWKGPGYDLIEEGKERFVKKTQKIREHANRLGIYLCHEIHPGTAASCADDFETLVKICDGDPSVVVNFDPSHCWEGEPWELRLRKVGKYVYAAHIKDHSVFQGLPLRSMEPDWQRRGMQFVNLGSGQINMHRYAEMLATVGYPQRYCKVTSGASAPLVVEAESAVRYLDTTSAAGIKYVNEHLCFSQSEESFEAGMGEK